MSHYQATVHWQRQNDENFLDDKYSRAHNWEFDGGTVVPASSAPTIVPLPFSVEENVDPEEALLASLSSCHMLFFLAFAAKSGFVIDSYRDEVSGSLNKNARGRMAFSEITLHPHVQFSGDKQPSDDDVEKLHARSHDYCFIANSLHPDVKFSVATPEK